MGTILEVLSVGRSGRTLGQPTKHVRTHTHKLKPLNHFTVVPQPLSPLRFNSSLLFSAKACSRAPTPSALTSDLPCLRTKVCSYGSIFDKETTPAS